MRKAAIWYPIGSKPSTCGACQDYFLNKPLLQAEIRHEGAKYGEKAAEDLLNEKLESLHEEHS